MNPDEINELMDSNYDMYDNFDEDPTWEVDCQNIHNDSGKYLL